jgi:hypothetical protein
MKFLARLLLLLAGLVPGCADPWPREPFTAEAWKVLPWQEHYRLCHSLLESGQLAGATRERVIELLGPPNGTRRPERISYLVRQRCVWHVVGEVKVLDVRFDEEGKVNAAFIRGT